MGRKSSGRRPSRKPSGPSPRAERVAPMLRNMLSEMLLAHMSDPALARVVITDVTMNADLSVAKIYWVTMDDGASREAATEALERARGHLRSQVGRNIRMRQTPDLRFFWDEGVEHGRRIETLLHELNVQPEDDADAQQTEDLAEDGGETL